MEGPWKHIHYSNCQRTHGFVNQPTLDLDEDADLHVHMLFTSHMELKPQTPLNTSIAFIASSIHRPAWPKVSRQAGRSGCCWYHAMGYWKSHWPQCLQCSAEEVWHSEHEVLTALLFTGLFSNASADGFIVKTYKHHMVSGLWPQIWSALFCQFVFTQLHCFMISLAGLVTGPPPPPFCEEVVILAAKLTGYL